MPTACYRYRTLSSLGLALLLTTAPARAELYKWVDEQGRTHYSDTAGTGQGHSRATVINLPPASQADDNTRPRATATTPPLLALMVHELPPDRRAIGSYHFGPFCQQAMPLYWPDGNNYHSDLMPDSGKITGLLMRALDTLGYPQEASLAPGVPRGPLLSATVREADIRACASDIRQADRFLQPSGVAPREFDRIMLDLTLDWSLSSADGREIYQGHTRGKGGSLASDRDIYQSWLEAVTDAAAHLHNDAGFQAALADQADAGAAAKPDNALALRQSLMRKPAQKPPLMVVTAEPLPDTRQAMGVLRAGQFCRNITPLLWPDIRNVRASLAPDPRQIASLAAQSLGNFDYSVQDATAETALAQQRRVNGLLLQIRIARLFLDACAPETREPASGFGQASVTYSAFSRHQLQLVLDWTLLANDGQTLFTGQTSSHAGSLQANRALETVYQQTVDQSVMQLLANPAFQQALGQAASQPATTGNTPPATDSNQGLLSLLVPDRWQQQAELAGILAGMSQLKIAMTEYYMSEGQWPTRFEQMQMPATLVIREAPVLLQPGGVLLARLPTGFGSGKELLLRAPVDPATPGAQWRCETNVDYPPAACHSP